MVGGVQVLANYKNIDYLSVAYFFGERLKEQPIDV
jgi:hypothetical protein